MFFRTSAKSEKVVIIQFQQFVFPLKVKKSLQNPFQMKFMAENEEGEAQLAAINI